jgi:hypothetical protein
MGGSAALLQMRIEHRFRARINKVNAGVRLNAITPSNIAMSRHL